MADIEVINAFRLMRVQNRQLIAIAHSHPRTAARPSETDLAEMHYPEAAMVIVSFEHGEPDMAAWMIDAGIAAGYREIEIELFQYHELGSLFL